MTPPVLSVLMFHIFDAVVSYTQGLFPAAAQSLVSALLHVSTACCIHHHGAVILQRYKQRVICQ